MPQCWDSLKCLSDWHSTLNSWALGLGLVAGIFGLFSAVLLATSYWCIDKRVEVLEAPRTLSEDKITDLVARLRSAAGTHCQVKAYVTSDESQSYAGRLIGVLTASGWEVEGPVAYLVVNEPMPTGIRVIVDSLDPVPTTAKLLLDSLKAVGIADVDYKLDPTPVVPSSRVLIQVGIKQELLS